jgi:DNA-binding protein WhiA
VVTSSLGAGKILEDIGLTPGNETVGQKAESIVDSSLLKKTCCRRTYLRWAFLSGGSVSDPEKTYHLEINNHKPDYANEIGRVMNTFGLHARLIKRKGNYVIYIKEGEDIVDFLNIIGAHNALLELENVRILKEMRNNVNRIVNCETANLEKTVNASVRQVENIKYIRDNIGFERIPENLREIAEVRLEYSDSNLKELGELLDPPLGKSGVNHRLRKLDIIAENAKESKGELYGRKKS